VLDELLRERDERDAWTNPESPRGKILAFYDLCDKELAKVEAVRGKYPDAALDELRDALLTHRLSPGNDPLLRALDARLHALAPVP
jgi:hypothetical protein